MGLRRRVRDGLARLLDERLDLLRADLSSLREEHEVLLEQMRAWEFRSRRDLRLAAEAEAARESARLVTTEMRSAVVVWDRLETLRRSLAEAPSGGMALEFGVFEGETLREIVAARPDGGVVGFDSFEGLPADWREGYAARAFATEVPDLPGAELVVGWFDETLVPFLGSRQGPVDFLHVDSDLYESAVTVLAALTPRFRVGTVIQFDEYFNYPGWQGGEYRAWAECVAEHGLGWEYLFFTGNGEQASVRITAIRGVEG